jgi:hypothetical protein
MTRVIFSMIVLFFAATPLYAELPPLIPRKVIFGNPVKTSPEISPDGKYLSFIAPDEKNVLQVWVQTLGKDGITGACNPSINGWPIADTRFCR